MLDDLLHNLKKKQEDLQRPMRGMNQKVNEGEGRGEEERGPFNRDSDPFLTCFLLFLSAFPPSLDCYNQRTKSWPPCGYEHVFVGVEAV